MLELEAVTKRYGETLAVDDLSFSVPPGRVTGFLGPNGAGKSTTMRLILGLDAPTAGRIRVNGRPFRDHRFPLREVGALLEAKAIHPGRTARSHLRWLADSNRISRRRVDEVLEQVGLAEVARRRAGSFSLIRQCPIRWLPHHLALVTRMVLPSVVSPRFSPKSTFLAAARHDSL
jgi:ABC-2 type transport system ATP-binding protein